MGKSPGQLRKQLVGLLFLTLLQMTEHDLWCADNHFFQQQGLDFAPYQTFQPALELPDLFFLALFFPLLMDVDNGFHLFPA